MSNSPKVSVVIPCFNRERYLGMAIQSVLAQSYSNFELIIVDNNSTDSSLEIAQIAASQDSRVRILTEQSQGASYALRTGFGDAHGEYVCQLDSDDLLVSSALEKTVAVLDENADYGLAYTNYHDTDENGKILSIGWRCSHPYSKYKLLTIFMVFHFRLMRKTVYQQAGGFDPRFDKLEDYELCLRISEITQIAKVSDFLYLYRNHPNAVHNENRLKVIELTERAINEALIRRNMDGTHKLDVRFNPLYTLQPINP